METESIIETINEIIKEINIIQSPSLFPTEIIYLTISILQGSEYLKQAIRTTVECLIDRISFAEYKERIRKIGIWNIILDTVPIILLILMLTFPQYLFLLAIIRKIVAVIAGCKKIRWKKIRWKKWHRTNQ